MHGVFYVFQSLNAKNPGREANFEIKENTQASQKSVTAPRFK